MKKPTRLLDGYLFCKSILSTWNNGSKYAQQCYTNIQHIIDVAGYNPKLTDINGPVLKQWLEDYRDERQEAGKDCTDATLNRHLATINTIYTQLSMEGLIDYRPLFRKWKEDGHRTLWHTEEEVELLVKTAKSMGKAELADRILLAAYCGPRSSEITNLRVCDVNFETQLLEIGGTQETRTKSRKYRNVGIPDLLLPMMHERCRDKASMDKLFPQYKSSEQVAKHYRQVVSRAARMGADLGPAHTFHVLRHTFGTWMIQKGVSQMDTRWAMGHSSITMTEKYVHNTFERKVENANVLTTKREKKEFEPENQPASTDLGYAVDYSWRSKNFAFSVS